ncbi:MAG: hypothetical protein DME91_04970 [Verrucomicrobia bacterium]|nr:MAG: hypothetical protein DME91_04970 [Verrucomicrobiota bacterium]PYJ47142.1 MAG: hypothetical protein DME85_07000 [Verrucomicrobiota bacterium]PYK67703.1 MAG: hypothetical protein DME50_01670 [Verrucomicrobiota bacterium]
MKTEDEDREKKSRDTVRDEQRANQSTSTAEVAKDLEHAKPTGESDKAARSLFPEGEANDFRKRWTEIQAGFVDEPRRAVDRADTLVAEAMKRLANSFAKARSELEGQWGRGDKVSTEDLRVALQHYRAFFERLLNM